VTTYHARRAPRHLLLGNRDCSDCCSRFSAFAINNNYRDDASRYAYLSLLKFLILLLISGHWFACLWVMVADLEPPEQTTWIDALHDNLRGGDDGTLALQARRRRRDKPR
jgi:hypothetical protein